VTVFNVNRVINKVLLSRHQFEPFKFHRTIWHSSDLTILCFSRSAKKKSTPKTFAQLVFPPTAAKLHQKAWDESGVKQKREKDKHIDFKSAELDTVTHILFISTHNRLIHANCKTPRPLKEGLRAISA
jgi:hypothetical protein